MRARPEPSDFARQCGSPIGYERKLAGPFRELQNGIMSHRVTFECLTRSTLDAAFARDIQAVTIIAHWDEKDRIECFDGFIEWRAAADLIPSGFKGTLDLCVCHPKPLVRYLNAHKPCLVRCSPDRKATILYWMALYRVMAAILNQRSVSFDEAFVEAYQILTA